ncbi:MAG TPA: DUF1559 domain-containing protein, partial [Pirellulales bacterium]
LNGKGWIPSILPQIEQKTIYDQMNFKGDFNSNGGMKDPSPVMRGIAKQIIPSLHCPSDPNSLAPSTTCAQWEGIEVATTNYKGCIGDTRMGGGASTFQGTEPDCHNQAKCNGLFWRNDYMFPSRAERWPDGQSNTFMLGEDVPEHNVHSAWLYSNGDYASCHAPLNYMPFTPTPGNWPNVISFRSRHKTGANFCMGDGSVHFVNDTVDQQTYRAVSTRERQISTTPTPYTEVIPQMELLY